MLTRLDEINNRRSDLITDVLSNLEYLMVKGQAEIAGSRQSSGCAVLKFEALTFALQSVGLLHPPAPPYPGLSLQSITNGLRKIKTEIMHYRSGSSIVDHDIVLHDGGWYKFHDCGLAELTNQIDWEVRNLELRIRGLELDSSESVDNPMQDMFEVL